MSVLLERAQGRSRGILGLCGVAVFLSICGTASGAQSVYDISVWELREEVAYIAQKHYQLNPNTMLSFDVVAGSTTIEKVKGWGLTSAEENYVLDVLNTSGSLVFAISLKDNTTSHNRTLIAVPLPQPKLPGSSLPPTLDGSLIVFGEYNASLDSDSDCEQVCDPCGEKSGSNCSCGQCCYYDCTGGGGGNFSCDPCPSAGRAWTNATHRSAWTTHHTTDATDIALNALDIMDSSVPDPLPMRSDYP